MSAKDGVEAIEAGWAEILPPAGAFHLPVDRRWRKLRYRAPRLIGRPFGFAIAPFPKGVFSGEPAGVGGTNRATPYP